jgi:hypothetical protein
MQLPDFPHGRFGMGPRSPQCEYSRGRLELSRAHHHQG